MVINLRGASAIFMTLGLGLTLSSCTRDEFEIIEIDNVDKRNMSAVVELCDRSTEMERVGKSLRASVLVNCEGGGHIRVTAGDQRIICPIGYVTSGLDPRHWRYRVRDGACEPLSAEFIDA
jgi:hypothetical protein